MNNQETNIQEYAEGRPVHVITMTGRELIGLLRKEWRQGDTLFVELSPVFQYGLAQQPGGNAPPAKMVFPAFLLEGAQSTKTAAVTVTYIDPKSSEYEELMRRGERTRRDIASEYARVVRVS